MSEFYLAACELAFRRVGHMIWQMQLTRHQNALPSRRDDMLAAETAAIERDRAEL